MSGPLPQRYTSEVNERIIENASRILAQAASGPPRRCPSRSTLLTFAGAGLLVAILIYGGRGSGDDEPGAVAFDRSSLISADATGTAARAGDFTPPRAVQTPVAVPAPHPESSPPSRGLPRTAQVARLRSVEPLAPATHPVDLSGREESITIEATQGGDEAVLYDGSVDTTPMAPAEALPRTLVAGTRLPVVLAHPAVTGPAPVPVTARVETDVGPIAAGTILNGEAFAVEETDRVQIVFRPVVRDARSIEIEAIALAQDELGIPGRVVRKGSKAKKVAGRAVGALGGAVSTLSFGLLGGDPGVAELAVSEMARQAGSDAAHWARGFSVSTKAVRIEAGARAVVFLRKDVVLP